MEDMVRALAQAPEDQRKTMLRDRLNTFLSAPEKEAKESMKTMLNALQKLPEDGRRRLVKSRTECLCEFPENERSKLMGIHMAATSEVSSDVAMTDMQATEAIVPELSQPHQQIVKMALQRMKSK
jgi:hypothetical protein